MRPKKPFCLSLILLLWVHASFAANPDSSVHSHRKSWLIGGSVAAYTGGMYGLYQLWYADYPSSGFHWIDDNRDWKQMDKVGHMYSCYQEGRAGIRLYEWAGYGKNTAAWLGGSYGLIMQTTVELFDGHSKGWGASGGDLAANVLGTALVVGQHLAWEDQRILLKYSFQRSPYAAHRPALLGTSVLEQMLKDYNGQTYWMSVNPASFAPSSIWPSWLNLAIGYGIDGFYGGSDNVFEGPDGLERNYAHIRRTRQWYLSPDIDLSRIKTDSKTLRTLLFLLNAVKVPMPTLELGSDGRLDAHLIRF